MIVGHFVILTTTIAGFVFQYVMAKKRHDWQMELTRKIGEKADAAYHEANGAKAMIAEETRARTATEAGR